MPCHCVFIGSKAPERTHVAVVPVRSKAGALVRNRSPHNAKADPPTHTSIPLESQAIPEVCSRVSLTGNRVPRGGNHVPANGNYLPVTSRFAAGNP